MAWRPDYCSTDELRDFVRIGDTADDVQLRLAIAASSRAIDRAANRQFGRVASAVARYYTAAWDHRRRRWLVRIDDLMSTTGLVVGFDLAETQTYSSAVTDYQLGPVNAAADGRPWVELAVRPSSLVQPTAIEAGVRVTALWGWSAVPAPIKEACLLQASRLLSRRDSPYGVAGSPEAGNELRLLAKLDPDVAVAVRPFERVWGAA